MKNKKTLFVAAAVCFAFIFCSAASAKAKVKSKYKYSERNLGAGSVQIYDFGKIKLHAYNTNDPLADWCYLVENKSDLVAIEAPCFQNNITEFNDYIASLGKPLAAALLAYHPNGGERYDTVSLPATQSAADARREDGPTATLTNGFSKSFGEDFDSTIPQPTEIIAPGTIVLGGTKFVVSEGAEGFDIEIPEINCVFTHMVGSDVHNILPSVEAIDALSEQMQQFIDKDYVLILTSHYMPETVDAARTKLAYTKTLKELALACSDADSFIAAVNEKFPNYGGDSFLATTAQALFGK